MFPYIFVKKLDKKRNFPVNHAVTNHQQKQTDVDLIRPILRI